MFSEYASRFLAQSQSRMTNFIQADSIHNDVNGKPDDRRRRANYSSRILSKRFSQNHINPYQSLSHLSRLNFTSRYAAPPDAPLFHSVLDDFREEDEAEERDRENADFFALQRSRRVFATREVEDSSEIDHDSSDPSVTGDRAVGGRDNNGRGRARGIKSSWDGSRRQRRTAETMKTSVSEQEGLFPRLENSDGRSTTSSGGRDKMVEVGLESAIEAAVPLHDLILETVLDNSLPLPRNFRSGAKVHSVGATKESRDEADLELALRAGKLTSQRSPSVSDTAPPMNVLAGDTPKHDSFWGSLYLICAGALFATFLLVYLHTSTSGGNIGDTIYTTLRASLRLFAIDTAVSIVVSILWLVLLRSFVKPLVYLILFSMPTILLSFSVYSWTASYSGLARGTGLQDRAMRWLSFVPGLTALLWLYTVYQGRYSLTKAISILEFASRILTANPALVTFGFGTLAAVILWTWLWLGMFTRVFLGGEMSLAAAKFTIYGISWWLGVYFVMIYIWTLSIIGGIQRSTTAATISQWYYHRNIISVPSSRDIVFAALNHAITTLFGTICYSTLFAMAIRLPLLILPRGFVRMVTLIFHSLVPTTITSLADPLTLTYAAIHSQPLHASARGLSQISCLMPQANVNKGRRTELSKFSQSTSIIPYRLAKLILHATRFIMAVVLGIGGWVATARQLSITMPDGVGIKGSAYAYVVGLVAGFIGWGVLGAMEGVLSGVVDAIVICWGSEKNMAGAGAYCLEADCLFGNAEGGCP